MWCGQIENSQNTDAADDTVTARIRREPYGRIPVTTGSTIFDAFALLR